MGRKILKIYVTYGTGQGKTAIAAFDKALNDAGISNLNLILLSSVIPKNSKIFLKKLKIKNNYGNKGYVVLSKKIEKEKDAFAGLAWTQDKEGKGLFVEAAGNSRKEVEKLLTVSLEEMKKTRNKRFGSIKKKIVGIKARNKESYVCAVVAALYKIEGW
ncbi:hypothetical protein B6U82_01185 [Candidatus Pacearchaeota archaeon ex4484_31]|nr:MAG: hypothetical protein B6U82_01185 [Candidatus Pacearchaeota archaeon ex4484_31]